MWARFRALAHRQVSGQLYEPTGGGADRTRSLSCCLSAAGITLLGHPVPACGHSAFLTVGPPATSGPAHDGVTTFHTHETATGVGCPPLPRDGGVSPGRYDLSGRRLPLPSGQSLHPGYHIPSAEAYVTRHHQGFTHVHPSGLPLTCSPRMVRAALGLEPRAPHPTVTSDARRSGDRHRTLAWDYPFIRTSIRAVLSSRATSCRTIVS